MGEELIGALRSFRLQTYSSLHSNSSKADRDKNIERVTFVSKLLTRNGVVTLCAFTKVREMLVNGGLPPDEFTRPEVARILMEAYRSQAS